MRCFSYFHQIVKRQNAQGGAVARDRGLIPVPTGGSSFLPSHKDRQVWGNQRPRVTLKVTLETAVDWP